MRFTIVAERNSEDIKRFTYDNQTNVLTSEGGEVIAFPADQIAEIRKGDTNARIFHPDDPFGKSRLVRLLKIQLGLSCNYSCTYCSQRFVERPDETTARDVEHFMRQLDHLSFDEDAGLKIEFWGGEPLVYIKTLKPLLEAIQTRFESWAKQPVLSIITNGSLLTREINDWIVLNGLHVGLSHDGPGQHVRGPDPLDEPAAKAAILNLYKRLRPVNRISFNTMLNVENTSRKEVRDFFVRLTGDENVPIGEGGLVDAYDEGGLAMLRMSDAQHHEFRRKAFNDIYTYGNAINFVGILQRIDAFTVSVLSQRPASTLAQKCGMDDAHTLAVDLKGNVVTCQNVSAVATAPNGRQHLAGHISAMDKVRVRTATHWSHRPHCAGCPVLHICQGSCMYLEGERWDVSCAGAYSDAVVMFALAFEKMTGYIPKEIISDDASFPAARRDIWGLLGVESETPSSS